MTSATATEATPHNPFVGKVMGGRYQVDRLIGRGGMGLVYLGREVLDDRQLVLKMLAPHWADDKHAVARFEREGKRLRQLRHPNIVELFDIGHEGDQTYIVMEFIRGIPLRRVLSRRGRLALADFYPIAAQLLAAVAYAHEQGVMLRDIKPSNVMLCERDGKANVVKVLDFGLAKMVEGDDVDITKANVIGTAGFLAPEQIRGESADVRVDVYALSIMFFIMLTGTSPILGENDGAILYNHVHGTPKRFADELPDGVSIPDALQALVYRCMAKDPGERPADAGKMLELLKDCVEPSAFELPSSSDDGAADIEGYWERKYAGVGLADDEPSSSLWTRPRLEELLEGEAPSATEGSATNLAVEAEDDIEIVEELDEDDDEEDAPVARAAKPATEPAHSVSRPEPGAPRALPPQPSAAIRARTSKRAQREATRVGLPALAEVEPIEVEAPKKRPKPARTAASSNMERVGSRPPPARRPKPARGRAKPPLPKPPLPKPRSPQPSPSQTVVPDAASTLLGAPQPIPTAAESKPAPTRTVVPDPDVGPEDSVGSLGPLVMELAEEPQHKRKRRRPATPPPAQPGPRKTQVAEAVPVFDPAAHSVEIPATALRSEPTTTGTGVGAAAEPLPLASQNRGVGVVLAIAIGIAVVLGGFVAWLALGRNPDPPVVAAEASLDDPEREGPPTAASSAAEPAPSADPVAEPATPDGNRVRIEGPQGATVFVDDAELGELPSETSLAEGEHTVRVEAEGREPWQAEFEVEAGRETTVTAELGPRISVHRRGGKRASTPRPRTRSAKPEPVAPPRDDPPSPKPKPQPKQPPPAAPEPKSAKPEPPPAPKQDDGVFMKGGKKKDDGIFLPVGKDK